MVRHTGSRIRQRGQAAVFVVVTLVVVLVSLNFLYKAGIATSEKMELQNAADATAYSVAVIEARDLNFAAYINRAMVANEVAIGQLVGLHSWAFHLASFYTYINGYMRQFMEPIYPPVTTPLVNGISAGLRLAFQVPGNAMAAVFGPVANFGSILLHNINLVYGVAQQVFHFASLAYGLAAIIGDFNTPSLIAQNAPGAKLSEYGMLALLAHAATFGAIPSLPGSFVKTYRSTSPAAAPAQETGGEPSATDNQTGMERFAAITRASRDDWSMQRGWELVWDLINVDIQETLGPLELTFRLRVTFELGKYGGSEIRHMGDTADGKKFGWSAADATGLSFEFEFEVGAFLTIDIPLIGEVRIGLGGQAALTDAGLNLELCGPFDICLTIVDGLEFIPNTAAFSAGSSQVGAPASGNYQTQLSLNPFTNTFEDGDYGGVPGVEPAWGPLSIPFIPSMTHPVVPCVSPGGPCQVPTVMTHMPLPQHKASTSYKGLPSYLDTDPQDDPWGFEAPFLLIGLIMDADDVYSAQAPPEMTGRLALNDKFAGDNLFGRRLGTLAKAEVYFKRPTDYYIFDRQDGLEEKGSAFNPYWNARLVETTHADRTVAMWVQQQENFYAVPLPTISLPDWGDITGWLSP